MQVNVLGGQTLAKKKSQAAGATCMTIYRPATGFKARTFELWVLNRWDLNFCVCNPLLRGVDTQYVVEAVAVQALVGTVRRNNSFTIRYIKTAVEYMSDLMGFVCYCQAVSSSQRALTVIFRVLRLCRRTLGERSFQYIGPVIWNSLPFFLSGMPRHSPLSSQN